ncbi:MAG: sulfite exporter TauE/SafE family protein [Planctomycetota bacterium]
MPLPELIALLITGLVAGVLGGLLGIGGSVIMIPVLTLFLDRTYHLAQATAMIVNIFVAVPAVIRHHRASAVRWDVTWRLLPFGIAAIVLGVLLSNRLESEQLELFFGFFLIYVIFMNVRRLLHGRRSSEDHAQPAVWWRSGVVGSITGFAAGLLGIGGGIITVPLLQRIALLPLRQCIATSSALMCLTAVVGASLKNATLPATSDGAHTTVDAMLLSSGLIPCAIIGSFVGAHLTHALPIFWVRIVFIVLLVIACLRFLGLLSFS